MTLKDRIDNNLTLYTLGLLLTGFVAGIGTYKFLLDFNSVKPHGQAECQVEAWQAAATTASWLPADQCPAFPIELKLVSPGNGSAVQIELNQVTWFSVPIVVTGSRSLPKKSTVGVIFKPADSPNYYVVFPGFDKTSSANTYRRGLDTRIPFNLKAGVDVELRAILVDDERKIGTQFASIEQIKSADPSVIVSEPSNVSIK